MLIQWIHTCYRCKSLLLSYPDNNIQTSTSIFFSYNGAFDIARSVRNVSGRTPLRNVKLACNKHSDIACRGYTKHLFKNLISIVVVLPIIVIWYFKHKMIISQNHVMLTMDFHSANNISYLIKFIPVFVFSLIVSTHTRNWKMKRINDMDKSKNEREKVMESYTYFSNEVSDLSTLTQRPRYWWTLPPATNIRLVLSFFLALSVHNNFIIWNHFNQYT